jgi:hypothetical protein
MNKIMNKFHARLIAVPLWPTEMLQSLSPLQLTIEITVNLRALCFALNTILSNKIPPNDS